MKYQLTTEHECINNCNKTNSIHICKTYMSSKDVRKLFLLLHIITRSIDLLDILPSYTKLLGIKPQLLFMHNRFNLFASDTNYSYIRLLKSMKSNKQTCKSLRNNAIWSALAYSVNFIYISYAIFRTTKSSGPGRYLQNIANWKVNTIHTWSTIEHRAGLKTLSFECYIYIYIYIYIISFFLFHSRRRIGSEDFLKILFHKKHSLT
jgi:hypothetical protein